MVLADKPIAPTPPRSTFPGRHARTPQFLAHPDLGYTGKHERLDLYEAAPTTAPFLDISPSISINQWGARIG